MIRASIANPYEYELDFTGLKSAAVAVLEGEGIRDAKVAIAFVDNAHIHRLNKQFLNHDEPTDVLTFPSSPPGARKLEGDIAIGMEIAREYATDRGHDVKLELMLYVVHGCLHLCGYTDSDDESASGMRVKERQYLAQLGLPNIA